MNFDIMKARKAGLAPPSVIPSEAESFWKGVPHVEVETDEEKAGTQEDRIFG